MSAPEVIDRAALNDLLETTGNDPVFLAELIDTYLSDAVALLAAMQQAVTGDNTDALRRAAHSLKSNSASLGARALARLCQEVEQQARLGVLHGASERVATMHTLFGDVERELRALRPAND